MLNVTFRCLPDTWTHEGARLWHPWLRINRVLRLMLHRRWSTEDWPQVKAEFKKRNHDIRQVGGGGASGTP